MDPLEKADPATCKLSTAIQRACRTSDPDPERLRNICGEVFEVTRRSAWDRALAMKNGGGPVWTPAADSQFPPDLISSGEDSDSSETDTEDSDSETDA